VDRQTHRERETVHVTLLLMAVALSSAGVAICCVLVVLWMTSY